MRRAAARAFALVRLPARGLSRALRLCVVEIRVVCGGGWLGCKPKSRASPRKIRVSNRQKSRVHPVPKSSRKLCCFPSARVVQDDRAAPRPGKTVEVEPSTPARAPILQVASCLNLPKAVTHHLFRFSALCPSRLPYAEQDSPQSAQTADTDTTCSRPLQSARQPDSSTSGLLHTPPPLTGVYSRSCTTV